MFSEEDAKYSFDLIKEVVENFNGDAEVFYPKFYKVVGQKGFMKILTDKTSTLEGYDFANHISAHLTKSKNATSVLVIDNAGATAVSPPPPLFFFFL